MGICSACNNHKLKDEVNWVKKKEDNIIGTQRQKKIIEYDPETGEPIYE